MKVAGLDDDLVERARMFDYIANLVQNWPYIKVANRPETKSPLEPLPKIGIAGTKVVCEGSSIELARRPLTLKLFRIFLEKDDLTLTREAVVYGIYNCRPDQAHSRRWVESACANAVKLISRARVLCSRSLHARALGTIEWFPYDQEAKLWRLYRLYHPEHSKNLSGLL